MILEVLRHALIPCPRALKRLGVLHDLIALEARARRQRTAWAPHRAACQDALLDAADHATDHALAVLVGTGLLLEIPLEALAARFDRVVCLDLFHMPAVRRRARRLPNVRLIDHDVTGLLDGLPEALAGGRLPPPRATFPEAEKAGLVASCNIASQLPLIPLAAAEAQGGTTPTERAAWARAIIADHFAALADVPGTAALITDTICHKRRAGGGEAVDTWDLLEGAALPPLADRRHWLWAIAPAPEQDRRFDIAREVVTGRLL